MLATICGGVISGVGDALIYMQNSSTGGVLSHGHQIPPPACGFGNLTFKRWRSSLNGLRCSMWIPSFTA